MTIDVCTCGHLLQSHHDWPNGAACSVAWGCPCTTFTSEDGHPHAPSVSADSDSLNP